MDKSELPGRLIELRKGKGQNRREAAEGMGMPYRTLTNYEQGGSTPRKEQILMMANYYGVTVDELLGVAQEAEPEKELDFDAIAQVLKDAGMIAPDHELNAQDVRFLKGLIDLIKYWFET